MGMELISTTRTRASECDHGRQRLLMRIVIVCSQEDELAEPGRLPRGQQVVEHAVKGLLAHRRVAGERALGADVHSVLDCGSAQHSIFRREVVGEPLGNERRRSDRQVRTVLLTRPDRHDESGILGQDRRDLSGSHLFEPARRGRGGGEGDGHFHR